MKRLCTTFLLLCAALTVRAQSSPTITKIDPVTQINWPNATGHGAPSSGLCAAKFYGLPYTDLTNSVQYVCSASGWLLVNGAAAALSTTGASGTFWGVSGGLQQWLPVVVSINGVSGVYTFAGPGQSCVGTTCTFNGGTGSAVKVNNGSTLATANFANNTGAGEIDFTNPSGSTVNATLHNTTISGVSLGGSLNTLTFGAHLAAGGTSYDGSANVTITSDAASANTPSTLVVRDASGNFSAGVITANLTGTASLATSLAGGSANYVPYQTNTGATTFLTPVVSAVMVTNSLGVPFESTTLPSGLTIPGYAACVAGTTGSDCLQLSGGIIPFGVIPFGTAAYQVAQGGVITAGGPTGGPTTIPVVTYNAAGQITSVSTAVPTVATVQGGASNELLYQSAVNTTGFVTPVGNAVLVTNSGGAPSESVTLPSGLIIPGYAPLANPTFTGTVTAAALTATGAVSFAGIEGAGTYCVQVSSSGVLSNTGAACGSGSGAVNSVANSDGTLVISPTTGSVVASLALSHTNTWAALQTFGTNISVGGVQPSGATGTGSLVFATSPTLVTPVLGTPASGVITNLTGTCASCTAHTATNLGGVTQYSIPYQSASATTGYVAPNVTGSTTQVLVSIASGGSAQAPSLTNAPAISAANMTSFPSTLATYPGAGLANSTGTAWDASYTVGNTGSDIPQLSAGLLNASVIPNNAANTTGTSGGLSGTPSIVVNNLTVSGTPTLSGIAGGSTYCVQISSSGVLSNTGAICGTGGSGSNVEVNGGGALGTANLANTTGVGEIDFTNPSGSTVNATLHNTTISGISLGSNLATLTFGTHLTAGGASYNGSTGVTITSDATNANTVSTIVARDSSGNFSAGTITATLNGNATSATSATSATNFTGVLSGDVTGTQGATVVVKVNGGSVPGNAGVLGSNSSAQLVSATAAQIVAAIGATAVANASNAAVAVNLSGTGTDYAPYQSASATTSYITAPTTSGHTFVYAWQPSGSAVAPTALDLATWYGGLTINATQVNGAAVSASSLFIGTNSSRQVVAATTGNLATFLGALTGCGTVGYPYVPADSKCEAPGTGTVTDGVGTTVTPEFAESTSATHVIQYVTPSQALSDLGAAPAVSGVTVETSSWSLVANNIYRFTGSGASNATTPATTGAIGLISFVNAGTATVTVVTGGPTLVCVPSSCAAPVGASVLVNTDGTDQYAIISNANGSAFGSLANASTINNSNWSGTVLASGNGGTGVANTATLTLGSSNQNWASLGTGIVKNTTTTGALSDAAYTDVVTLWASGSCSGYLKNDGTCGAGGGGGSSVGSQGQVQAAGSTAGSFQASSITDNGTTVSTPENFAVGSGGTPTQISTTALPIANLPAASTVPPVTTGSNTTYTYKQVLDGTTASDCTVGGGGNLHWCYSNGTTWIAAVPAGTVTGVTGTAPVSSSGGTAPVISMHVADASDNGYLASADWSTFNGKQAALSLTAGTYVNGDLCTYTASGTLLNCNTAIPTGTVTTVSVATANGVSGSVTNATTTPAITLTLGAITPSSSIATGIQDGQMPTAVTTGASASLGGTYSTGLTINENATAATAITYTLPTAATGKWYCVTNGYNGSAANTGALELLTSAAGQYIIWTDGTLSASGGYGISAGAARDSACVVGQDSTHWILYTNSGVWTKH